MGSKIYDIPFRTPSSLSDFACTDGELLLTDGAIITDASGVINSDDASSGYEFNSDFSPQTPPPPDVRFALKRAILKGWHPFPEAFPSMTMVNGDPTPESWGRIAKQLLQDFEREAVNQNLLTSPVRILAAWRLADGSFISPSHPQTLVPNSEPPIVSAVDSPDNEELELRIAAALGSLQWRISLPESLRDWVGKIISLDIMVSSPQQLYDPDKSFIYGRRVTSTNYTESLDAEGSSVKTQVCTQTLPYAWKPVSASPLVKNSVIASLNEFFTIASIPLGDLKPIDSFRELSLNDGSLTDAYSSEAYQPSYAMQALEGAVGAIRFKGRTILWGPRMKHDPSNDSYIWVSEKSDPPVFEDSMLQDLECGEIIALCRAFRTAGLVATVSPTMYVFTSEGVFLFKENGKGLFSEAGLMARDVLSSPEALQVLAHSVRFVTQSGDTAIIDGTTVRLLSSHNTETGAGGEIITVKTTGLPVHIVTRPLKLSGAGEFKYVRRVFLRGDFHPGEISLSVCGSRDMIHWYLLGRRKEGAVVYLNPVGCRFFRIEISGTPSPGSRFEGLTII